MADRDDRARIFLEGSLLRAQVKLEEGAHPEDIMMWLYDRLEAWIETMLGSDQPNVIERELAALRAAKQEAADE